MKRIVGIIVLALIALAFAGCGSAGTHSQGNNPQNNNPIVTTAPPVASVPTPSPNGTYQGSCDYTLTTDYSGNGYDHLIGEIDLINTGNIGAVDKVRITWPQEGYPPIVAKKTVRTTPGQHLAVRFHIAVASSGNVITQLQSWQQSHGYKDGCTYKVTTISTFGSVQGG